MAGKKLYLRLLAPEKADERDDGDTRVDRVETDADMVILRCVNGDWGVLAGHEERSAVLDDGGLLRVMLDGGEEQYKVYGGLAEVRKRGERDEVPDDVVTVVTVLAGSAEFIGKTGRG